MKLNKYLLLFPLFLASCSSDPTEDIYTGLNTEQAVTWNYFVKHKDATEIGSVGITERRNIGNDITGFDELQNIPFYFDGSAVRVDGKTYNAIPGEGIPFSKLQILNIVNSRMGKCSAQIDSLFNDLKYDASMQPTRTETKKDKSGAIYQYIYYDGVPSKTRSGISYVVDFEIF